MKVRLGATPASRSRPSHLTNFARLTWLNTIASSRLVSAPFRRRLLRLGGVCAHGAVVGPGTTFINGSNVAIGAHSTVGSGVLFDARERIEIGEGAVIGPDVMFVTSSHEIGPPACRAGVPIYAPIVVEDGAWIGAGAVILGRVTIGAGCRIEAGALVNRNCEPNGLYAGIPAREEALYSELASIKGAKKSRLIRAEVL